LKFSRKIRKDGFLRELIYWDLDSFDELLEYKEVCIKSRQKNCRTQTNFCSGNNPPSIDLSLFVWEKDLENPYSQPKEIAFYCSRKINGDR
jgi:hypothetical protein